jgi:Tfp pilus assembly protein PilN
LIEINLLPGATKRKARSGLPRLGGGAGFKLPAGDRTTAYLAGVAILSVAMVAWLHLSTSARLSGLHAEHEAAARDSARYAQMRAQGDSLRQQVAVIGQKLEIIQELDGSRYIWPHILDELSRALPPYVWIVNLTEAASNSHPRVRIEGRAGTYYALGRYMRELENSAFLSRARLISSSQTRVDERTVYAFVLEVGYQDPPPDAIETVPLFAAAEGEN